MIRINLLSVKRKKKVQPLPAVFLYGAVVFSVIIVVLAIFTFILAGKISNMKDDVAVKETTLKELRVQLKEVENFERDNEDYRKKSQIIVQLKKNQNVPLRLLDEVSIQLPDGVWLTALTNKGVLNVIDYGGSLGSTYYQCNKFFLNIVKLCWNIIEQPEYVNVGVKLFENEHLKFYYNIDDCIKKIRIKIVLLLSVLQYITNPYELLKKISEYKIKYLIIDRTPIHHGENDIITVQHVPKKIYKASYPCWIFSKKKLMDELLLKYKIVDEYHSGELPGLKRFQGFYFGAILELK